MNSASPLAGADAGLWSDPVLLQSVEATNSPGRRAGAWHDALTALVWVQDKEVLKAMAILLRKVSRLHVLLTKDRWARL